jgi:DNA-binding GntR family transcriptional regulator
MSNLGLPKLRLESLAERAYHELKASILSGDIEPGTALAEVDAAHAMGISRTPVREAFALLRRDGLLDGSIVRSLQADEVRELFLVREALECVALREYASSARDVGRLEGLLDRQRKAMARGDVEGFLTADEEFHLTVCREAGLTQVAGLLSALREKMRQAGMRAVAERGRMRSVIGEHEAIVEALRTRSAARATKALRHHLAQTRAAIESAVSVRPLRRPRSRRS